MAIDRTKASLSALGLALGLVCLSAPAFAADYYLEGPPQSTRSDAVDLSRTAAEGGYKARVVRRYRQGVGWQYLVRVEGFDAEEPAREAARSIAARIGLPVSVFLAEGEEARSLEVASPEAEPSQDAPAAPAGPESAEPLDLEDPEAILARASRAHGGTRGGIAAIRGAEGVLFRFRRTLPDGLVVDHTWARLGDSRFLEVDIVEGEGRSSRLIVGPAQAWLAVEEGAYEETDLQRAADTVSQLHPEQVLPFVLVFADAIENRRELELLQASGVTEVEGSPAIAMQYEGDRTSGPMALALDRGRYHVLEVSFEGGELVHRFDGWKQQGRLVLPSRVRTWRAGELVDTVEIQALEIEGAPPKEWFEPG